MSTNALWEPAETTAASIPFTPTDDIEATNMQAAIEEVAAESGAPGTKVYLHTSFGGF